MAEQQEDGYEKEKVEEEEEEEEEEEDEEEATFVDDDVFSLRVVIQLYPCRFNHQIGDVDIQQIHQFFPLLLLLLLLHQSIQHLIPVSMHSIVS